MTLEGLNNVAELYHSREELENSEDKAEYQQWLKLEQLEVECSIISWKIIKAEEGSKPTEKLTQALRKKVSESFDLNQKMQKAELKEEMQLLKEESQRLERRDKNKDKIVNRRIEELTKPLDDELDWN